MTQWTPPPQEQERQPGIEADMTPRPDALPEGPGARRLEGKVGIITGGDSGIGRAVAVAFAREGADVAVLYLDEHQDAERTIAMIEEEGRRGLAIPGDVGDEAHCREAVRRVVDDLGRLDVLVNNAGEQHEAEGLEAIDADQMERTFRTNVYSMFFLTRAALAHLPEGGAIVNSTSVTAYKGHPTLIDYASTKGAILAFTRSLAANLVERGIRVNAVAPGPVWTPLIPASFDAEHVGEFGTSTPMQRPGQPAEIAPCYVFLASEDASYMTGQTLHPNGGTPVGG
jgi:NAD(P)-dependent dehydrogenase (short-subunit alcohol dehydrogenase family)